MTSFQLRLWALAGLALFSFIEKSFAYDEDTHFYGTYTMARYAGIRHEVATKIALAAQWMDESYISDPTSMILMPLTGIKKRRLLHFPSSRVVGSLDAQMQRGVFGFDKVGKFPQMIIDKGVEFSGYKGKLDAINFMTETKEDHPFASELMMEGLKAGNLMMASASLHTLEDSYAHAGTPAEQGHAFVWHWPDRPFASVEKYFRMTNAVFHSLVAIRSQLPKEALDCNVNIKADDSAIHKPNCEMTAQELQGNYSKLPIIRKTVAYDVLKDPEYVVTALRDLFKRATKVNYLNMEESKFISLTAGLRLNGSISTYEALEILLQEIAAQQTVGSDKVLNLEYVLSNMGLLSSTNAISVMDYIESYGMDALLNTNSEAYSKFVHVLADEMLKWDVPVPLDDTHRMEVENDSGPVREKETEIRIRNIQNVIKQMYNVDLVLVPNNSKDDFGFWKEVKMDPRAEAVLPNDSSKAYATFSLAEKNAWDHMIFNYLFPNLKPTDLDIVVDTAGKAKSLDTEWNTYLGERDKINNSDSYWTTKKYNLIMLDRKYAHLVSDLGTTVDELTNQVLPMVPTLLRDTLNTHIIPSPDNYFYRSPRLFKKYRDEGIVQPFLGQKDIWNLSNLNIEPARVKVP